MKRIPFSLFSFHCPENIQELIWASEDKLATIQDSCRDELIKQGIGDAAHIKEIVRGNAKGVVVLYADGFDSHVTTYEYPIIEKSTGKIRLWFFSNARILPQVMLVYLLYKGLDPGSLKSKPTLRRRKPRPK